MKKSSTSMHSRSHVYRKPLISNIGMICLPTDGLHREDHGLAGVPVHWWLEAQAQSQLRYLGQGRITDILYHPPRGVGSIVGHSDIAVGFAIVAFVVWSGT